MIATSSIDVGDIERAVMQRETGRAVESLDPFPRDDGAVGPELGDEAVAVLLHDGAGDIADIERRRWPDPAPPIQAGPGP